MPVETQILDEQWQRSIDLSVRSAAPVLPEEGLLAALEQMDALVRRVVLVEDNADAARLISRILQARGSCDVRVAANGADGLALIRETRPDLVITDLMMPGVDGFTLIDAMKADPTMNHIPIIVVTAKELTAKERARLGGQINLLLQKGSFIDEDFVASLISELS